MASVLTVNIGQARPNPADDKAVTGIDKRPVDGPVGVRSPGPMHGGLGSGLIGDAIGDQTVHGGDDQAVYAYAREDLDVWQSELDREIGNGVFGENLTTSGIDLTNVLVGERWRVGTDGLELEVSRPRIPCRTFAAWLEINGWIKTFIKTAVPGSYLRLVTPGSVRAGDEIVVTHRPDHQITVGLVFRALTLEPALLPEILHAEALPEALKDVARRRSG